MHGRMQDWPLLMHKIIDFAAIQFPEQEVVSRTVEGPMHYTNYRDIRHRALKVAKRLHRDGIKLGDRIATLAWNGYRHLESWYGITGGGGVYHTVNPRLFPEQIAWIINHAEDRMALIDLTFVPLLEAMADHLPTIERYVILTDHAHMPATKLKNAIAYEDWIGEVDSDFAWREFDERTAAGLCYTSGTTGNPKGVLYSHRSNVLHSMMATGPETLIAGRLRFGAAGRADVPRQFMGSRALLPDAGRAHGDAGPAARRRLGSRPSRNRKSDDVRRRPDRLARAAALPAQGGQEAVDAQVRR